MGFVDVHQVNCPIWGWNNSPAVIYSTSFTGITAEAFCDKYRGAKEELTTDASKARGRAVEVTAFVDAFHSSDKKTRQSHIGYIISLNHAPIIWYIKIQATVEAGLGVS